MTKTIRQISSTAWMDEDGKIYMMATPSDLARELHYFVKENEHLHKQVEDLQLTIIQATDNHDNFATKEADIVNKLNKCRSRKAHIWED